MSSDQDPVFAEAQTRVLNQLESGSVFLTKLEIESILRKLSPGSGFDAARIRIRFLKMLEYRTAAWTWIPVLTQRGNGFGFLTKLGPGSFLNCSDPDLYLRSSDPDPDLTQLGFVSGF